MVDRTLESLVGGGGSFIADSHTGAQQVPIGSSGELIRIDPGSDKSVVLYVLGVQGSEPNITVTFGNRTIIDDRTLIATPIQGGDFAVSGNVLNQITCAIPSIQGRLGEVLVVSNIAPTAGIIYFTSAIGS